MEKVSRKEKCKKKTVLVKEYQAFYREKSLHNVA